MALRFRQVHLDFHTSEKISGVGDRFDARQFQEQLKRGAVDSITLFSKCHHGMTYHQTNVGVRHPGMPRDLLPRQIEACCAIDVKTPIYLSAGFDEAMAFAHPDWCVKYQHGQSFDSLVAGWKMMSFGSPYLDYLCAQIEEVVKMFGADDGIFLDIIGAHQSFDNFSIRDMTELGLDPQNPDEMRDFSYRVLDRYFEKTTASCKIGNPQRRVFHNSGHIPKGAKNTLQWNSHLELESLPTGGWGYDHFPISSKYVATTGYDFLGMTGKFHTTWGEFGGFKRANALRYECDAMLAFGAKCSVGDQLHPSGAMNADTYDLIGAAYEDVQSKEEWCGDAHPISEIALFSVEALHADQPGSFRGKALSEEGAARMLLELHHQFDVVDGDRDLSGYKVLVLPDDIVLQGALLEKVRAFRADGGKLLLSGASGMNSLRDGFALDLGLQLIGRGAFDPDYIVPTDLAPTPPVRGAFIIHGGAWNVANATAANATAANATAANANIEYSNETQVLAQRADSYFNRAWNHFCSHQHAPDAQMSDFPAAVAGADFVYFAHDIFTAYRNLGQPLYRDLVADALKRLLPTPVVETSLPTAARVSLMRQKEQKRTILHLLFAVPVKRGADVSLGWDVQSIEVIEDLYALSDVECRVRLEQEISAVRLVPSGESLDFALRDGAICFTVPRLLCHQMVEMS